MIVLTGASATGKTATALLLQKQYGLVKAITTTTRPMRVNEVNGVDYFFISREEFLKRNEEKQFVENTLYNGNFYGCGVDQIADNKVIVLDPNGLHAFIARNDSHIVTFFMTCDKSVREKRMVGRGDQPDKIRQRLENDTIDFDLKRIGKTDFIINTDDKTEEETAALIYKLYIDKISNIKKS